MKTKSLKDLELNLILIKNEINFIYIELIKHDTYKADSVQKALRGLMSVILTYRPDVYIDWSIVDSDPELINELKNIQKSKDRLINKDNSEKGFRFALNRFNSVITDLEFSACYNDLNNENLQHYLLQLISVIVNYDLSIFLIDQKKYNVYDYADNLIKANINEIELSRFLANRDSDLYLIQLADN